MTEEPEDKDAEEDVKEDARRAIVRHLGDMCEEYKITNSLFLALDPDNENEMIMYYKGSKIMAGKMAATFNKLVKQEILEELS